MSDKKTISLPHRLLFRVLHHQFLNQPDRIALANFPARATQSLRLPRINRPHERVDQLRTESSIGTLYFNDFSRLHRINISGIASGCVGLRAGIYCWNDIINFAR